MILFELGNGEFEEFLLGEVLVLQKLTILRDSLVGLGFVILEGFAEFPLAVGEPRGSRGYRSLDFVDGFGLTTSGRLDFVEPAGFTGVELVFDSHFVHAVVGGKLGQFGPGVRFEGRGRQHAVGLARHDGNR